MHCLDCALTLLQISSKKEKLDRAYNERGWADERSYGGENGGQEGTRQKARIGMIDELMKN